MFADNSRYKNLPVNTHDDSDGRRIPYVRRRFLPRGTNMPLLAEIGITEGDRLDLITARTLGDPQQYWRICDANDVMNPKDLVSDVTRRVRVPIPQFESIDL